MERSHHHQSQQQATFLDWRRVAPLLASDAGKATSRSRGGSSGGGKKLCIRILDTVFFGGTSGSGGRSNGGGHISRDRRLPSRRTPYGSSSSSSSSSSQPVIAEWIYTSKKGEVTMRKGTVSGSASGSGSSSSSSASSSSSSLWSHVCDRFGRIALSDAANSAGPRIVATGRGGGSSTFDVRCHLTVEQLRRDVCGGSSGSLLAANRCQAIQGYVRPHGGVDRIFRAIYTVDGNGSGSNTISGNPKVDVVMVEDGATVGASCASVVPLDDRIVGRQDCEEYLRHAKKEVQMTTLDVVTHVESVLKRAKAAAQAPPTVTSASMDFIWDDQNHLWLSHLDGMRISNGSEQDDNHGESDDVGSSDRYASSSSLGPLLENHSEHIPTPIIDGGDVAAGGGGTAMNKNTTMRASPPQPASMSSTAEMDFIERNGLDVISLQHDVQRTNELLTSAEREKREAQEEAQLFQERINELENELENTRTRLDNSSQSALDANNKIQTLSLKLAKLRKQMLSELQTKDDEHARMVLELESQVNAKKAEVARLQAAAAASSSSSSLPSNGNDTHTTNNSNAASEFLEQDLLAKIDSLHNELMAAKRNWGQERRSLASSHAAAEQERAAKHRQELAEQRAAISSLEDDVVAQKERTRDAEKESIVLLQKLSAANHRADEAQSEAAALRDELDLVKQSMSSLRESSGGRGDGDSGGGSNNAKSNSLHPTNSSSTASEEAENKIRTLNNKVEYLKAQLQSEVTVKEEYKSSLSCLRKEKEALVDAHRCRLSELEGRKEQQILQVQEQLRVAMKRPLEDDVVQLQEEIKALQIQLEEAKLTSAEARQCELDAQARATREQSLAERIKQELETARNETAVANREIDRLKDANLDATANEGVLRRLDNERRYLKNQLHLEIASKAELLKKVEESDQRIKMVQDAGKHEQRSLSLELKKEKHSRAVVESQLRDSNQILEAEVKVQKNQIEELRQAYAATRDQLRMEQATTEQIRASGQRMAEELKAAQDELKYLRCVADDDTARHNETTRAISDSLKKADDMRAQEVCRLQEETQHALQKASDTQRDMLNLRAKTRSEQTRAAKTFAAHHLTVLFAQRFRLEKQRAFASWQLQTAVVHAQRIATDKLSSSIEEAVVSARAECTGEWQTQLDIAQEESAAQVKETENRILLERSRLLDQAEVDQEKAVREESLRLEAVMREKETTWTQKEKDIHSSYQSGIAKLTRENNQNLEFVQANAQRRIDEAKSDATIELEERKHIILRDCNRQWETKLADLRTDLEQEMQDAISDAAQQHNRNLREEQAKFAAEEASLKVEMESAIELAVAKETERMNKLHANGIGENNIAWTNRVEEAHASHVANLEDLQVQHQQELSKTMAALEYSRQERERDLRADLERRYSIALEKTKNTEQQRINEAVEREARDWEKRMRELQAKMEVECRQQFDKGQAEGSAKAVKEIEDAHIAAQDVLAKERNDAEARVKRALDAKAIEVERVLLEVKTKQKEAVAKALEEAKAEHERQMKEAEEESKSILEQEQKRLSILAEQEMGRAVTAAAQEHDGITKALRANLEASELLRSEDKESFASQLEQVKANAEDSMKRRLADLERQTREQHVLEHEQAQRDFDRQRLEWKKLHKKELEKVKSEGAERSNTAILMVQEDAKEAMRTALDKLATAHEEQEAELRAEIELMMEERDSALQDIALLQSEIVNQQSAIENTNEELNAAQKSSAIRILRLATSSMLQQNALNEALQSSQAEFNTRLQAVQEQASTTQESLEHRIMDMEDTIKSYQAQRKLVQDVLLSHNRDVLLRQKAKSREVLSHLDAIGAERQTLQDKRRSAEEKRDSLENQIRELEANIQQHSQTSSLQGGRINIAHARKKRALDEAYDILLDKLEANREELCSTDEGLKEVMDRKEIQEERRKEAERALVEILLDQIKKVMQIHNGTLA